MCVNSDFHNSGKKSHNPFNSQFSRWMSTSLLALKVDYFFHRIDDFPQSPRQTKCGPLCWTTISLSESWQWEQCEKLTTIVSGNFISQNSAQITFVGQLTMNDAKWLAVEDNSYGRVVCGVMLTFSLCLRDATGIDYRNKIKCSLWRTNDFNQNYAAIIESVSLLMLSAILVHLCIMFH